jgi:predicted HTH transcriptional regulator
MFDICANKHGGNPQSVEANEIITFLKKPMRNKIYDLISISPHPLSCEEIEEILTLYHQTASARISELKRAGKIMQVGLKENRSGCKAAVYGVVNS